MSDNQVSPESQIAALKRAIAESDKELEALRSAAADLEEKRMASEKKHLIYHLMHQTSGKQSAGRP